MPIAVPDLNFANAMQLGVVDGFWGNQIGLQRLVGLSALNGQPMASRPCACGGYRRPACQHRTCHHCGPCGRRHLDRGQRRRSQRVERGRQLVVQSDRAGRDGDVHQQWRPDDRSGQWLSRSRRNHFHRGAQQRARLYDYHERFLDCDRRRRFQQLHQHADVQRHGRDGFPEFQHGKRRHDAGHLQQQFHHAVLQHKHRRPMRSSSMAAISSSTTAPPPAPRRSPTMLR